MSSRTEPASSAASAVASEALVGKRINKYEIVRIIGRGGMGTVYEALNTAISKRVAMKFVDAETARNKDAVARFQREAEAASAVESAHIVEIFDSGCTDDGLPYIVMELLRGEDLGHRIKRCGRLDLPEAVHITAQILRGLHRAHKAGIVHRDLKPDNVFLVDRDDDASFAKILDFGISKVQRSEGSLVNTLTRQGTVLGTPFYMSPEQAQALPDIDGRTDLWSMGAILYECLTGRPPYTGASYEQVIVNICMHNADDVRLHNPGVPEGIAQLIARALARDRADRWSSAREFLDALKATAGGMVSSRPNLISSDDSVSSGGSSSEDFRLLTPRGAGQEGSALGTPTPGVTPPRTPSPGASKGEQPLAEPTLDVNPAGTSKVGWSTSRRQAARREKRTFLFITLAGLLVGGVSAFLIVRHRTGAADDGKLAGAAAAQSAEAAVQLETNVATARVLVDGVEAPGGLLKGKKGELKKVRIEADGYMPSELEVTLEVEREPLHVNLVPVQPVGARTTMPTVVPAVDAPGTASADPGHPGKGPRASKSGEPIAALPPLPRASATPSAKPTAAPTVAPKATGVGGELKLKTD